jgi:hypothetical protein
MDLEHDDADDVIVCIELKRTALLPLPSAGNSLPFTPGGSGHDG